MNFKTGSSPSQMFRVIHHPRASLRFSSLIFSPAVQRDLATLQILILWILLIYFECILKHIHHVKTL